ncbi:solute carrier family 25 member 43-like, partial [Saccoglossus kowalevskii]|uniref:Solute carrier family 25 member 43-like n=1 Tax=Saccoglossus kowalevskii TaxID=10224 RepID=A0ABM0GME1_SACKO
TVPFACVYYMTYEILQEMVWRKPRFMLSPTENFFNGCLAAAVAQTASYPFDTIRKKLQAQSKVLPGNGGCDVRFHSLTMGFRVIIDRHGIVGLWRGLTANLLKVVPYHGLMFATFEALRRFYLYENGYTRSALDDSPKPGT